ncbi:MAG: LPS export ABC transporter permease LptG [Deltaproteobacteria bacterium]|nr:LPS export ABC transporter permease LptG [Deltaproteobacteria bacterium]MBW2052354.1 LPS export ABC transporter permease LptG [Deltaproteobacteria bacterium]MBW2139799.1 LPS export ABC transporter permease LptG [Deltaproteobacteria bacterium]MBW2322847.1 LPS export ABC transporter permease LptG [Deltaproteobacteria bacterium]
MRVVNRYLLKEFIRILAIILLSFVLLYLIVDFLEKIDNFLEASVPLTKVGYYYLMSIPEIIFNVSPVGVLVSVMISLGLLARHSEVVALKAGGFSLLRISVPFLGIAILFSLIMFGLAEAVIPYTSARTNYIWNVEVEKRQDVSSGRYKDVWYKGEGIIYNCQVYDQRARILEGVSLFRLNDKFAVYERIEAKKAQWKDDHWLFSQGLVKTYLDDGRIELKHFDQAVFAIPEMFGDFSRVMRPPEEMDFKSLLDYANRMEAEGHDPVRYWVDLHFKIAFPVICFVMTLIGLPIALWKEKGGGIALGIGAGIGLSFVYFIFLGLSRSLGYTGLLPPAISAWLPNVFFMLLGSFLFTMVRQ